MTENGETSSITHLSSKTVYESSNSYHNPKGIALNIRSNGDGSSCFLSYARSLRGNELYHSAIIWIMYSYYTSIFNYNTRMLCKPKSSFKLLEDLLPTPLLSTHRGQEQSNSAHFHHCQNKQRSRAQVLDPPHSRESHLSL